MKTPTWDEIKEFCQKDGWSLVRDTDHEFYQKLLPDGRLLETHVSFSGGKTMSPGRFKNILRVQLEVSEQDFWDSIRLGRPAPRPSSPLPEVRQPLPDWVLDALRWQMGVPEAEIAALSPEEAERRVREYWSRPRP